MTEFDLPGPPGKRFDYLAVDTDDHYLFSAHLAAGQTSSIAGALILSRSVDTMHSPKRFFGRYVEVSCDRVSSERLAGIKTITKILLHCVGCKIHQFSA